MTIRRFALSTAICAATMPCHAHAANSETQFWFGQLLTVKASPKDIVTIDIGERARADRQSGGEQFLARIALDHAIAPRVQLGGGIAYFKSEVDQELRLFQQLTLTKGFLQSRTRLEQRFFDTLDEASWRLRQRVQVNMPLDKAKQWTLVGGGEFFFHLNRARPGEKTGLAVLRQQVGLRHPIGKSLDVQLVYMRQQTLRDNRPDVVVHVPWLTLNWRI